VIESRLPDPFKQAEHLPGSEERLDQSEYDEANRGKRSRLSEVSAQTVQEPTIEPYLGQDGQYYYDYGTYGYNHETQQYDPARLYQQPQPQHKTTAVTATAAPSIQDRVDAALAAASAASSTSSKKTPAPSSIEKTSSKSDKPAVSALSALAAYGSESESEGDE
jgi:hypothetical protein